jgi:MoaA/NifB/PqqE/SkfB family radical SAM enzyme
MSEKEFALFYKSYLDEIRKRSINLDITYRCPLECPFCQRQRMGDDREKISRSSDMTLDDYNKILKFFKTMNFCGQISDPIYHSEFLEILKISTTSTDKKFEIHTNGTRKKLSWWEEVFNNTDSRFVWTFGLDGTDQESANKYRVNTKYDEVMEVMKLGASLGKNIQWQFIVFKHNEHQIEEAKKIAKENSITLRLMKSSRWHEHPVVAEPSPEWKSKYKVVKQFVNVK